MTTEHAGSAAASPHDAVPAATAHTDADRNRTDKAALRPGKGAGNTHVAESATPDGYAYAGWPHPKGKAASISDAEIDALEFVVEEGRIASQMDFGVLRSLLVRLRPEWLDRPEPIKGGDSDMPKPISHTPPTLTDDEREAIKWAALVSDGLCQIGLMNRAGTFRGILERLG